MEQKTIKTSQNIQNEGRKMRNGEQICTCYV